MSEKICPVCKKKFACKATDEAGCWCMQLPPALQVKEGDECFCPDCLSAEIKDQLKADPEKAAAYIGKPVERTEGAVSSFQEGLDYYINTEGNWVFTTFYHLKKGYCCQNECRHCPYGFKKTKT